MIKKDWEIKKLGELTLDKMSYGTSSPSCEYDGETRYIRITDINDNGSLNEDFVSPISYEEKHILQDGDIVFARTGATVGKAYCYHSSDAKYVYAGYLIRLRPNKKIVLPDYIFYYTKSKNYLDFIRSSQVAAAQPNVNAEKYSNLEIPIPPLEEQKRIVKILDEKFAQLETIKTNAQTNLQNAKDLLFAELTKTFSNETWSKMTLQEVCTRKITDGTHQTPKYCTKEEGGFPFISSKDVTKEYIDWSKIKYIVPELHEELHKRIAPQKNDVLLAKNGTTGVAAIVEDDRIFDIYVTLAVLRPNQEIINPRYLLAIVNSPLCKKQFDAHLKGSGVPNLHLEEIQKIIIPVPPLNEQKKLISKIEVLKEKIHSLQEIYTKQIANCNELKQAYLQKAFEGEL